MTSNGDKNTIGIIAGNGMLPRDVAFALERKGQQVFIIGIAGECSGSIRQFDHKIVTWEQVGLLRKLLKKRGISKIVLAGGILRRPEMNFLKMDWEGILSFLEIFTTLLSGDNKILTNVIDVFEKRGLEICNLVTLLPELFVKEGLNIGPRIGQKNLERIRYAASITKHLGSFDIGQAAVIVGNRVVALEGAEGTDAMLCRVSNLRNIGRISRKAGGILYKSVKPGQDERADLPSIGPRTVHHVFAAGLNGIGVEAGKTIVIEQRKTFALAQQHQIFIYGLTDAL
ncbi:LpxI family protein [Candidatus Endowatersipora endosymbiont of Watersipora subatra]|uniref:LpxI family protein n=1 Tax=Candidatus Endowatersipora endosymbiont of Watersipora subatra TaxID=3077946 RepID=UPI00312C776E